uniref:Antifreeze protein type IV n=1 Tax=Periophthalmus magnuspinnatus TaxID=409849 RepID=A0A3B4BIX0_9GOBI
MWLIGSCVICTGSLAQDSSQDLASITQYLEDAKNKMIEEMNKIVKKNNIANIFLYLSNHTTSFCVSAKAQLEAIAPQVEQQLKTVLSTMEETVKPLQEQMQPLLENFQREMEVLAQKLTEKAKAIAN